MSDIAKIIESLSPIERNIVPFLEESDADKLVEKSGVDKTSVMRALEFLSNKGIVEVTYNEEKIVDFGLNGLLYKKKGLPERRLAHFVGEHKSITIGDAKKKSGLSDNEFSVALGALKKKALINLINGRIMLIGNKSEISEKTLDEKFLESLPRKLDDLQPEEQFALKNLELRKNIVEVVSNKTASLKVLKLGEELMKKNLGGEMVEVLTPKMIKNNSWKGKKFRRYDITSPVPQIYGGKKHFVNQAKDYARKIWLEMGFKEMEGNMVTSGFWNFDSLFTAQDHPARELHDTFFIDKVAKLPDKQILDKVKSAHEGTLKGSKGLGSSWDNEETKKVLLRTHTTCLSSQTLSKIDLKELPAKYFALGKCFRNDTVDWSHGFEFNQTEGIVIDENANFRHLLGYLKEFAKKMGYEKVRFRPHYFPYTEPSLEGDVWNEEKGEWMEVFAAGIFRPEVTEPLLGKPIKVLAWGPGFDRMMMLLYGIKDLRELYKNDLNQLRKIKFWPKS
jgi:phenylalanyl-tRNA synthetase alpha chain